MVHHPARLVELRPIGASSTRSVDSRVIVSVSRAGRLVPLPVHGVLFASRARLKCAYICSRNRPFGFERDAHLYKSHSTCAFIALKLFILTPGPDVSYGLGISNQSASLIHLQLSDRRAALGTSSQLDNFSNVGPNIFLSPGQQLSLGPPAGGSKPELSGSPLHGQPGGR